MMLSAIRDDAYLLLTRLSVPNADPYILGTQELDSKPYNPTRLGNLKRAAHASNIELQKRVKILNGRYSNTGKLETHNRFFQSRTTNSTQKDETPDEFSLSHAL